MDKQLLAHMANRYGTPLYAYDGSMMEAQYNKLKNHLPEGFEVFYSVKSNPLLGICQYLRQLGSRIEVASLGELHIAFQAGFDADDIIFTSPGKTREELEYAVRQRIYCINVESVEEADRIDEIARSLGQIVRIAIRINPSFNISGAGMKMTGVPTQFGIDQEHVGEAIQAIQSLSHVDLAGIHIFTGTQILDAGNMVANMEAIIGLFLELTENYSIRPDFLDLGGGFGVPYFAGEVPLDMNKLREGLAEVWTTYKDQLNGVRIGVESGRFLLAESGVFLTKVLYTKECKGSKYLVCDGGSNQHASSAFLGRYVRNNFPMYLLGKEGDAREEVNVVGSLCTPTDVMGQKVSLPPAEPGDILVIDKSGAYGLTHSPVLFLGHALPAEVLHVDGAFHVLRERGKPEDLLRGQHPLQLESHLQGV
ncbi:type III PLP-dependent enzyme [Paenibacillus hexagrammi]|uniref:Type III PLP-dependent enzyme n=1 Tax=Paenibacillus hexagrammi TaxID=2908839 RepID=A0ABY3SM58_9BACL|nr:type III PLP-dependent enzyme [Paenibacillus sp. YPD9-1]UJF34500.1 type III PLP-dependent enzyme [Paenibacillus sp. YPD9-1]